MSDDEKKILPFPKQTMSGDEFGGFAALGSLDGFPMNAEERARFDAQQEQSAKKFEAFELERRKREFIDHVAVQLWVGQDPVWRRLNGGETEGKTSEQYLEQLAGFCAEEAARLWRRLHP